MRAKYIYKGLLSMFLLVVFSAGCESYNEAVLQDIGASREFSPIGLTAKIRTQTTVELNWTTKEDADHYVVEFSADDTEFKTIYKTINVTAAELPVQVQLEGETVYSIRVKAVSATGLEDSKWSTITATTLSEQLFSDVQDADIEATQVTLRWVSNSNVTQITLTPGEITHVITPEEKTAGVAVVTGLTGETIYTATLLNGVKKKGIKTFTTGIDIGTGILVKSTDDLNAKINESPDGAVLVLMPGDYKVYTGEIILNKSITIRGLRPGDKPKLHVRFTINSAATALSLIDLDLNGDKTLTDVTRHNQSGTYGKLLFSGCIIHDFDRSLAAGASGVAAKIESVTIENSILTNVGSAAAGGEFIDYRSAFVANIIITKSTFNNCAPARAFIREDPTTTFGTGLTSNTLIDSCTFYGVTNTTAANGYCMFYIRFVNNSTIVRNSIFAETIARHVNNAATATPTFSNNNYYNAATLNMASPVAPVKSDATGSALNPQFVNVASGDFTIKNGTLLDNKVGDPRWIK
jgi:hypothetical protein